MPGPDKNRDYQSLADSFRDDAPKREPIVLSDEIIEAASNIAVSIAAHVDPHVDMIMGKHRRGE